MSGLSTQSSSIACHECDLLVAVPQLGVHDMAHCPRCNYRLAVNGHGMVERLLAFSIAGLVLLGLSLSFTFLTFSAQGLTRSITLIESIFALEFEQFPVLAGFVLASVIGLPAIILMGVTYLSASLALERRLPLLPGVLRAVLTLLPWSMAEIFLIGILVSFIKIVALADVTLGPSFWVFVLFTLCLTLVSVNLDRRNLWAEIEDLANE